MSGVMFPTLLGRRRNDRRRLQDREDSVSPSPGLFRRQFTTRTHATADFTEADEDEDEDDDEDDDFNEDPSPMNHPPRQQQDAGIRHSESRHAGLPVLPLFSATHLDTLPVYNMTHAIRVIVSTRTETSLTWEQLRSPQISQFLVKPMQQQIRAQHFSRSTLYALMANCLQFTKEGQRYAANAGISNTRAKVCELLSLKLLKEYSTRELIDALAYDFYPLQGMPGACPPITPGKNLARVKTVLTASRTSTLEVAIRASAKHFLAHPVVVQQLEAIWNGAISFYSAADSLHREHVFPVQSTSGMKAKLDDRTPLLGTPQPDHGRPDVLNGRRTVMLYDPRQASVFKLSRLRVPRYRSFLSTLSLAVLIGLFLAVLIERSVRITGLELVFWFWSAGFMVDELVGFNEQGFALYIMSFWNIFDLGILLLLIVYYCMRAYGVFLADPHHWNDMAYDVLAANAILLLPRIFSVLDHYQYFSQLLIAFRLMAVDLAAVFTLVLIMCSGFYVFFTLSNNQSDGAEVAYKIFQILMGFTPAAWDVWPTYNWLARILMMVFLIICHFLVVTILITVLTNSFMTIASNANEEHQFVFAINTISMVKNDALFSYIAPTNIFAWILMPLRYCMPLRQFVWLNRMIIKVTHFPILLCIYLYEKFWLARSMFEPTDLVDNKGKARRRAISFADPVNRTAMFSPNIRAREESVAGFHKDQALEEVFLRVPDTSTLRTHRRNERHQTQNAIRNWMEQHDEEGMSPQWPTVDSRAVPEWQRRSSVGWERPPNLRHVSDVRSTASDPVDFLSNPAASFIPGRTASAMFTSMIPDYKDQTDADGDDELVTNDEDEDDVDTTTEQPQIVEPLVLQRTDYFGPISVVETELLSTSQGSKASLGRRQLKSPQAPTSPAKRSLHKRTISTNTILYNPEEPVLRAPSPTFSPPKVAPSRKTGSSGRTSANQSEVQKGQRSPPRKSQVFSSVPARPIIPPRGITEAGGVSRTALMSIEPRHRLRVARRLSSVDLSAMSDNTNLPFGGDDPNQVVPGSFQTQMAMAMMRDNRLRGTGANDSADRDRMGRLVLARMKTLEESFADVIKEMRDLKHTSTPPTRWNSSGEELRSKGSAAATDDDLVQQDKTTLRGYASPQKGYEKRPASRRSLKEGKTAVYKRRESLREMKEIHHSSSDEGEGSEHIPARGSSL